MNADLLNFADMLDSLPIGNAIATEGHSIMRTGDDTYNVEPAWNGRAYLSMIEVLDCVAGESEVSA